MNCSNSSILVHLIGMRGIFSFYFDIYIIIWQCMQYIVVFFGYFHAPKRVDISIKKAKKVSFWILYSLLISQLICGTCQAHSTSKTNQIFFCIKEFFRQPFSEHYSEFIEHKTSLFLISKKVFEYSTGTLKSVICFCFFQLVLWHIKPRITVKDSMFIKIFFKSAAED